MLGLVRRASRVCNRSFSKSYDPSSFIDQFGTPFFAVSLRDLTGTDANVIHLRRTSDNTERGFKAGELKSGGFVETWSQGQLVTVVNWPDQSGNGRYFEQQNTGFQPHITDSSGNFLGKVSFIDDAHALTQPSGVSYTVTEPFTFYQVHSYDGATTTGYSLLWTEVGLATPHYSFYDFVGSGQSKFNCANVGHQITNGAALPVGQTDQFTFITDNGNSRLDRNGSAYDTSIVVGDSTNECTRLSLGNGSLFGINTLVSIKEVVFYDDINATRDTNLAANQTAYWETPN